MFKYFYHKSSIFIGYCSGYYPLIETVRLLATVVRVFSKNIYNFL